MYGVFGGEVLFRDITKPWYLSANYYWVKQREFNQRFSFRKYETYTGHLNFIWETPYEGFKVILSGGRYLARDSGVTINLAKSFKTGFTLGFYATKLIFQLRNLGKGVLIREFTFLFLWMLFPANIERIMQDLFGKSNQGWRCNAIRNSRSSRVCRKYFFLLS